MDFWLQIFISILLATVVLFIIVFKSFLSSSKRENSLDSRRKGLTILITGPKKSGKTVLFQKLSNAPKLLPTAHSIRANSSTISKWTLLDLPMDMQALHSQPADFFHFNDLRSLILCIKSFGNEKELDLIVSMTVAVGIVKNVPLFIFTESANLEKSVLIDKLISTLLLIQKSRLSNSQTASTSQVISFNDPINRLIFESPDGDFSTDFEEKISFYFDENVSFSSNSDDVKEWITKL